MNNFESPLISIIIPIYNVEPFLARCVDSILKQTYRNLEIFLVNDGSPDKCGEICDRYALLDSRIKVMHKKNGGLSDARNVAIDIAKGAYIIFLDSDDFVTPNYVQCLYNLVVKYNAEVGVSDIQFYKSESDLTIVPYKISDKVMDRFTAMESMLYQRDFDNSAWAKIYKSELFDDIRYPVGLLYEDLPTTYKLFLKATNVAFTNERTYYYFLRESSILGQKFSPKKLDAIKVCNDMMAGILENAPQLITASYCKTVSLCCSILMPMEPNEPRGSLFWAEIKKYRRYVLMDSKARTRTRIACVLSFFGLTLMRKIFSVIDRRK